MVDTPVVIYTQIAYIRSSSNVNETRLKKTINYL